MTNVLTTEVLIVGAGPVGMTMAMDLHGRGIRSVVLESRRFLEPPSPKCNHVAARTMEQFRRLGIVDEVRSNGLPPDYPHDAAFRTTVTGIEMARIRIPARSKRFIERDGPDGNWPTPEPPHRINQIFLEPILLRHAASLSNVTLLNRTQFVSFTQDEGGIHATALNLDDNTELQIHARYIIGCEGGRSLVRKAIGASLTGTPVIQNVQSTCIRAPQLLSLMREPAWGTYAMNPRRCGTIYAIDGIETWLVHNHLQPGEQPEDVDRDRAIREILGVGADFEYDIVSEEDWVSRRLVADHFRDRRAFIAGDAAHLWVPYAGYGMNAGIADGLNLAWHLSTVLKGWGGPAMLDAYAAERQPITEQVSHFAMNHAQALIKMRGGVPADIEAEGPEGDALRAQFGAKAYELNVAQFCCAGLNFGYFYDASPVIVYDDEKPPAYSMGSFTASTVPGCRAPHFTLRDGRSLYDAFGPDYTLLVTQDGGDLAALLAAAHRAGVPVAVLDLRGEDLPAAYAHRWLLCRPDQAVAWRANQLPEDLGMAFERLRGAV
jgi:2-polyprenyl-6-methoxyphenol hydroxylase-like FAD-dependent oxidoreductase